MRAVTKILLGIIDLRPLRIAYVAAYSGGVARRICTILRHFLHRAASL